MIMGLNVLGLCQSTDAVLNNNHRAINNQAKIQRPQAHQVGRHPGLYHAGNRGQHRQRDHRRGDQGRAQITQQREQHHDHQQCAFKQVFLHRGDGFVHQGGAVVHSLQPDTRGQRGLDRFEFAGHRPRYRAGIFTHQHHRRAQHCLCPIAGGRAGTQFLANSHIGHIGDLHRRTVAVADHYLFYLGNTGQLAGRAHQQLLTVALDITRSAIAVIGAQGTGKLIHADAKSQQPLW